MSCRCVVARHARAHRAHGRQPRGVHRPGQKGTEVGRCAVAVGGAGLQVLAQPGARIDPPQPGRHQHAVHRRGELPRPLTARAVEVLARDHRRAHGALGGVVVHRHLGCSTNTVNPAQCLFMLCSTLRAALCVPRRPARHRAARPCVARRSATRRPAPRPRRRRHRVGGLSAQSMQLVQLANLLDPLHGPGLQLGMGVGQFEEVAPLVGPAEGQHDPGMLPRVLLVGAVAIAAEVAALDAGQFGLDHAAPSAIRRARSAPPSATETPTGTSDVRPCPSVSTNTIQRVSSACQCGSLRSLSRSASSSGSNSGASARSPPVSVPADIVRP